MMFSVEVRGKPEPWGVYTKASRDPAKHRLQRYQDEIRMAARQAWGGDDPYPGQVRLWAVFYGDKELKGDLTNYIKASEDALQEIVYENDNQVKAHGPSEIADELIPGGLTVLWVQKK